MCRKLICVLVALLMAVALCACAKPDDNKTPSESVRTEDTAIKPEATEGAAATQQADRTDTPSVDDNGSVFVPTEGSETAFDEADPETVQFSFTGLKEADVTAEQLSGMDIYDYSESEGEDTPIYSGPLVSEVLRLVGADNAKSITVKLGGSDMTLDFALADIDLSSAIFAVIKDGKLITDGTSNLILTTSDGFNYILNVADPYILG